MDCHCTSISYIQNTIVDCVSRVWGWTGVYILLWYYAEYLPIPMVLVCWGENPCLGTNSTSPCSMNCIGGVFSNEALLSVCGEQTSLDYSLRCLGILMGLLFANNSIIQTPILILVASFGVLFSHYLAI